MRLSLGIPHHASFFFSSLTLDTVAIGLMAGCGGWGLGAENVRAVRVRMAGALRRIHSPQHIRRAAALYAAAGEAALAEATEAEAAAWQT